MTLEKRRWIDGIGQQRAVGRKESSLFDSDVWSRLILELLNNCVVHCFKWHRCWIKQIYLFQAQEDLCSGYPVIRKFRPNGRNVESEFADLNSQRIPSNAFLAATWIPLSRIRQLINWYFLTAIQWLHFNRIRIRFRTRISTLVRAWVRISWIIWVIWARSGLFRSELLSDSWMIIYSNIWRLWH